MDAQVYSSIVKADYNFPDCNTQKICNSEIT